jgi:hypothetical protein
MGAPNNLILEKIRKLATTNVIEEKIIRKRLVLSKDLIDSRLVKTIGNRTAAVMRACMKSSIIGEIFTSTF